MPSEIELLSDGSGVAVIGAPGAVEGKSEGFFEIMRAAESTLTNPALLASAGGIMAQLAMLQAMEETIDCLARIDEKHDGVLRTQTDQVLARMDGVDLLRSNDDDE